MQEGSKQGRALPGPAMPEAFGNPFLKQVDSNGEHLAEFEAEPQPCLLTPGAVLTDLPAVL